MSMLLKRYSDMGHPVKPEDFVLKPSLRINSLKTSPEALLKRLKKKGVSLTKIPFLKYGYYYEAEFSLGATPEYLQGLYYLQEAASQVPAHVLDPKPGEVVLDMAASPGSKTTQIAQMMKNEGTIIALDVNVSRLEKLHNNLERMGVKNVVVYRKDARFVSDLGVEFDKILLDAPCSGNFCIEPEFFLKRSPNDFADKARTQKQLLAEAFKCLKKGGILVYSTCSLEPEEDEMVVDWALKMIPNIELVDAGITVASPGVVEVLGKKLDSSMIKTRKFWPNETGTEGFFVAKLRKKA